VKVNGKKKHLKKKKGQEEDRFEANESLSKSSRERETNSEEQRGSSEKKKGVEKIEADNENFPPKEEGSQE